MPRPHQERTLFAERYLRERVALERERQGMTYESLAKRMTDVGCQIQPSALYKVEKGEPPRRVTVDELVALSIVFKIPMAELIIDPSLEIPSRAVDLWEKMNLQAAIALEAQEVAQAAWSERARLMERYEDLVESNPDAVDGIFKLLESNPSQRRYDEHRELLAKSLRTAVAQTTRRAATKRGKK